MRTNLTAAFRAAPAKDRGIQARLRLVQREFDYMWSVVKIYSLYRAGLMADDSMLLFDLMAAEIRKHRAKVNSWYTASGKMRPFYRWPVVFANAPKAKLLAGGNMSGAFAAPFTWDLDGVRKGRIAYRSKKSSALKAVFVKKQTALMDIPRQETLNTTDGSKLQNKTLFATAYDDKNLFFMLECDWLEADKIKIKPSGAGGSPWNQESVDILVCTSNAKDKYHHFIFNPAANSFYLGRFGFVTNALDPGYGKYEKIDSHWEYKAWIDLKKKKWYAKVKIPFETLGVKTPAPGYRWTINVSRLNFTGSKRPQFSIWSQIPGEPAFKNPAAFGDLVFE